MEYFDLAPEIREFLARLAPRRPEVFGTVEEAMREMDLLRHTILINNGGVVWEGWCDNPECFLRGHAIQSYDGPCTCNTCGEPIALKKKYEEATVQ